MRTSLNNIISADILPISPDITISRYSENYQLSKSMKLLQISNGYHKFTSGIWPMSNLLTKRKYQMDIINLPQAFGLCQTF